LKLFRGNIIGSYNLKIAEHAKIHVIELSKWNKSQVENDLDIWTHFFKEGKSFSMEGLPEDMHTHEMEEAMAVLKQFSEKEQDYDRYLLRVEYLREQKTLQEDKEQAEARLSEAEKQLLQVKAESNNKDHEIIKKDHEITNKAHEITKKDHEITNKAHEITKKDHEITKKDHEIKNKAHEIIKKDKAIQAAQVEIEQLRRLLEDK
jgi:uncharacterized protein (DUF3084 family)